jgi:protein PhnA
VKELFQNNLKNRSGIMNVMPKCPKCSSEYTYKDSVLFICPECAYEWAGEAEEKIVDIALTVKDANGTILQDGDTITVIKDLKVKGASLVVKVGTKVKNIKLVEGDHDIDCRIEGIGPMKLKSQFVKKV